MQLFDIFFWDTPIYIFIERRLSNEHERGRIEEFSGGILRGCKTVFIFRFQKGYCEQGHFDWMWISIFFFILILDQMNNFKSFMCAKLCIIGIKILDHLSLWTKFIWGHIGSFMSMSIYMSMSIHLTVWMGNLPANFCKEISDVQTSRKLGELIFNIGLLFLAITLKRGRFLPHNVKHPSYFLQNLLFPIIGVDWKWDIYMVQTFWYLTHKPLSFLKIKK